MPRHHAKQDRPDESLETLVRLADEVVERTRLRQARVELATALQRTMLPASLPVVPRVRAAACYSPARQGLDVGGDWYDMFAMPGDTVGVAIGDVQGHDVEAAAFVGQVRTGLRVITTLGTDSGDILARLNDLLVSMDSGLFVTCSFFHFAPATGELTGSRAGHVPAVLATRDGRTEIVLDPGGLPLGVFPDQSYPVTRRTLTSPGVVVLVTDGVVEGPAFPLGEGLARVVRVAREGVSADPAEVAENVLAVADATGHSDDAAVVVLSHDGPPCAREQ